MLSFCFLCVIIDCLLQFKDVGSPIADEVMEEQDDTERTKTKRTDQQREHVSHTQHTMPARGEASMSATFGDVSLLDRSMYYLAPIVYAPVEQQMYFDTAQLPSFTPPDALHVSVTEFSYMYKLTCY